MTKAERLKEIQRANPEENLVEILKISWLDTYTEKQFDCSCCTFAAGAHADPTSCLCKDLFIYLDLTSSRAV